MITTAKLTACAATLACMVALCQPTWAAQPKGYILNSMGKKCWYEQETLQGKYLQSLPGKYHVLRFNDPTCMPSTGLEGDVNIFMINNAISKNHARDDADFGTRRNEMGRISTLQVRGQCLQSRRYPNMAMAVEYEQSRGYFTQVTHGFGIGPCKN